MTPAPEPKEGVVARRPRRKRSPAGRLEDLLDRVSGKGSRERGDRKESNRSGIRVLDIPRNRELFERLVRSDYDYLMRQRFAVGHRNLTDLLPQSVLGRAQNGHGWFTDEWGTCLQFPDATFDRVLTVLEASAPHARGDLVRKRRGDMLRIFSDWILDNLWTPELELVLADGPVFGVELFAGRKVETRAFLTGMVLAGFMDDWTYRETTMMHHKRAFGGGPFHIGGGEILIVDREKFNLCGLGDTGQTVFGDDRLRGLVDAGVIVNRRDVSYRYPEHDQVYFRRCAGDGVSDDLALMYIGRRYGFDAMLGAFTMDAMDTYDKYVVDLAWGGQDTDLARTIQRRFLDREDRPLVDDRAILDLIHFAAKRNDPVITLSSSHRRFIQIEWPAVEPTLLNHWRFLQGEPVADIKLGYSRMPARDFYAVARSRFAAVAEDIAEPSYVEPRRRKDS